MPDLSGLELAKELTRRFNDPIIFFITNYEHYLDEAFDIHAFRYLYKPVEQERFFKSLDKAVESCEHCAEKHVLLDVYELNGTFLAINLTNSRETEPKQKNGRLVSDKADRQNHGIGMESVRRCIEKYRGDMEYFYDKDKKTFSVTVLMNLGR